MNLISLRQIDKTYWMGNTPVHALRGVSLDIKQGEFVAVMGPSGSGKSTLLNVLGLLDGYDSGSYQLAGVDTSGLTDDERALLRARAIGFVFQQFNLLPRLSASENIELPLLYQDSRQHAGLARLTKTLTLTSRLHHRPSELSGGQQQRVAIARALVNQPKLILADEPTGNLDSHTQREIMGLLAKLNRAGLTIILVTHELDIARYARRKIWMRDGRIISDRRQREPTTHAGARRAATSNQAAPRRSGVLPVLASIRAHTQGAIRALAANKVRAFLSTLGITIGVAAVIAVMSLGNGVKRKMEESFSKFATNVISVHPNYRRSDGRGRAASVTRLTVEDAEVIRKAHHAIQRTAPTVWRTNTVVTANGRDYRTRVAGCTLVYADLQHYRPSAGRFFTERELASRARVCLIGHTVIRELFDAGDNPIGQTVRLNRVPYTVIGILPEKGAMGSFDPDDLILMPLSTGMYRFAGTRYISVIDIEVDRSANMEEVITAIKSFLSRRYRLQGGKSDAFTVRNWVAMRETYADMTNSLTWLLAMIAGISLLVGGIGIMNIMLVSVTERTREIGLRKAVGARRKDILFQFLVEATSVSMAGGVIGILLGVSVALGLALAMEWPVSVTLSSVVLAVGFSAAVGIGFGFWPARRAAALHPSEALRYE